MAYVAETDGNKTLQIFVNSRAGLPRAYRDASWALDNTLFAWALEQLLLATGMSVQLRVILRFPEGLDGWAAR